MRVDVDISFTLTDQPMNFFDFIFFKSVSRP